MKTQLIDYLYNEMSAEEKIAFEIKLKADPALKRELDELQGVRQVIQAEREVVMPVQTIQPMRKKKNGVHPMVLNLLAIAASLALLMIVGSLSNFHVQKRDGQFVLGFGTNHSIEQPTTNPNFETMVGSQINQLRNDMELLISQKMEPASYLSQEPPQIQPALSDFKNELTSSQREWTRSLLQQYQQRQDQNVEKLINELLHYWDSQRQVDRQFVNQGFDQILQTIESRPDYYNELLLSANTENY